jgi:lactate dehydrogenase-like 2-hydroxyacid dehydrogenase
VARVLASRRFPGPAFDELPEVEVIEGKLQDVLGDGRPGVFALATLYETVDDAALDLLPDLRIVANNGVGYDGVDVPACAQRGVAVTNTPGAVDGATADLAMALLLATRRRLVEADALVRRGDWDMTEADAIVADDFHSTTLGIVGCGRIGKAVARRARGFDMRLLYTQRTRLEEGVERELGVEYRPELAELFAESDAVTLHTPLTAETEGLVGAEVLSRLRDGGSLVNTARGGVVDQPALVEELASGRISAGLDVFDGEPDVPDELLGLSNVILTPHMGTATVTTREAMTRLVVDNILAADAGRPLITPVEPPKQG